MLNYNNLLISSHAGDSSRFGMDALCIMTDATMATDGKQFIRMTTPKGANAHEFPTVPGIGAVTDDFKPFLLPAADAAKIAKGLPSVKRAKSPALAYAAVSAKGDQTTVVAASDPQGGNLQRYEALNGSVPSMWKDWQRVVPVVDKAQFTIRFNVNLLGMVLDTVRKTSTDQTVYFRFYGQKSAIRLDWTNTDYGQDGTAAVMPWQLVPKGQPEPTIGDVMEADRKRDEAVRLLDEFVANYDAGKCSPGDLQKNERELVKAWKAAAKNPLEAKVTPRPNPKAEKAIEKVAETVAAIKATETEFRSWKPQQFTDNEWVSNGVSFATKGEAEQHASDLHGRSKGHRAIGSDEEPNYTYKDGKLTSIAPKVIVVQAPAKPEPSAVKEPPITEAPKQTGPVFDAGWMTATFASKDGLTPEVAKRFKVGKQIKAKREACEPCSGKGKVGKKTCKYCLGNKTQVAIENPGGNPIVVDLANVTF